MNEPIVVLCGGVGGARAALALSENLPSEQLTFVVNTGDDFCHLGLEIWPDWDTVVYHLTGLHDQERGWGRAREGSRAMEEFRRLGAPDWFHLGDRDLALHVYRHALLREGRSCSEVAHSLTSALGLASRVLPVTEGSLSTRLVLADGREMEFQEWFVAQGGRPAVSAVVNPGSRGLPIAQGVREAIEGAGLVVMAPSNPYLSLGPMLGHPEIADLLCKQNCKKVAVSPLIGGRAVKGPLDALIETLSPFRGQEAIAHYWSGRVDALLLPPEECQDAKAASHLRLLPCPTLLKSGDHRASFAEGLIKQVRDL